MKRHTLLTRPRKDGHTFYEHMAQAIPDTDKWPVEYQPVEPPEEVEFVWDIFWELRSHSKSGFAGAESLSFQEIEAWQRIRGCELPGPVVDMILAMDSAYLAEWHKESQSEKKKMKPKTRGRRR